MNRMHAAQSLGDGKPTRPLHPCFRMPNRCIRWRMIEKCKMRVRDLLRSTLSSVEHWPKHRLRDYFKPLFRSLAHAWHRRQASNPTMPLSVGWLQRVRTDLMDKWYRLNGSSSSEEQHWTVPTSDKACPRETLPYPPQLTPKRTGWNSARRLEFRNPSSSLLISASMSASPSAGTFLPVNVSSCSSAGPYKIDAYYSCRSKY